jgi:hypothetical protein
MTRPSYVPVTPHEHNADCRRGLNPSGAHYGLDRERCERCRNLWQRLCDVHVRERRSAAA